jgi:hypothetical protein
MRNGWIKTIFDLIRPRRKSLGGMTLTAAILFQNDEYRRSSHVLRFTKVGKELMPQSQRVVRDLCPNLYILSRLKNWAENMFPEITRFELSCAEGWHQEDFLILFQGRKYSWDRCMLSSELFPGVCSLKANVSEHPVCSIFIGELVWSVTRVENVEFGSKNSLSPLEGGSRDGSR